MGLTTIIITIIPAAITFHTRTPTTRSGPAR
jgi:hypothetical protein